MCYEEMSLVELKQLAKEKEIKNISKLRKEELIIALQETDNENDDNMDDNLIKKEQYRLLYDNLKKLKQEYQIAIYLVDFQGFEYKEVCKILNKTMPQTKMLIHRARKALNKLLRKEDY